MKRFIAVPLWLCVLLSLAAGAGLTLSLLTLQSLERHRGIADAYADRSARAEKRVEEIRVDLQERIETGKTDLQQKIDMLKIDVDNLKGLRDALHVLRDDEKGEGDGER